MTEDKLPDFLRGVSVAFDSEIECRNLQYNLLRRLGLAWADDGTQSIRRSYEGHGAIGFTYGMLVWNLIRTPSNTITYREFRTQMMRHTREKARQKMDSVWSNMSHPSSVTVTLGKRDRAMCDEVFLL